MEVGNGHRWGIHDNHVFLQVGKLKEYMLKLLERGRLGDLCF